MREAPLPSGAFYMFKAVPAVETAKSENRQSNLKSAFDGNDRASLQVSRTPARKKL
jgi:hypothetical protein